MSNKKELTLLSLFDGSGGFPLAGALFGIEPVWASEIEPYPIRVTTARFPNMKHLGDITKINATIRTGKTSTQDVETTGVLGVIFDHDALGVSNLNNRVTSHYNAKGEFTNLWYKTDGSYFNDYNENCVVFVAV